MGQQNFLSVDPHKTMTIPISTLETMKIVVIGIVLVAIGILISHSDTFAAFGRLGIIVGWFISIFFGLTTLISGYSLISPNKDKVVLTPTGLLDTRYSSTQIPWISLTNVSTLSIHRKSFLVLDLPKKEFDKLQLKIVPRSLRRLNSAYMGKDNISIHSIDLEISFEDLKRAIHTYAKAHNPALSALE